MPFSYDVTQASGLVRLLCVDTDSTNYRFDDTEIVAFLNINNQDVRLAGAQGLDALASQAALIGGRVRFEGLMVDGQVAAEALKAQASELRRQVHEADQDGAGLFDWAEMVQTTFSLRERLLNELLRKTVA